MSQEFFERFPTLMGVQGTIEMQAQIIEGAPTQTGDKRADYVAKFYEIAKQVGKEFSLNPIIILAQAALESGWGTSNLARNHNNFFGITAYGKPNKYWTGDKVVSKSSGLPFRTYKSVADGFRDFARIITSYYKEAARNSFIVTEYARLIANSPYINEKNGDNRSKYKEIIIRNAVAIAHFIKKFRSLYS